MNYPLVILLVSFVVLWTAARLTATHLRKREMEEEVHKDFDFILGSSLTLLSLLIGFNLVIAVNRYDQRIHYEEAEANAIGTEYVRADLMAPADGAKVRALLKTYIEERMRFFTTRDPAELREVAARRAALQADLWAAVAGPALAQPTPIQALVVNGMNDVLNSQGYTQAAFLNRIPLGSWGLMAGIALCCNVLIGFGVRNAQKAGALLFIVPLIVSISFFLIADIDSPRGGLIRVSPQNLQSLATSLPDAMARIPTVPHTRKGTP